MLVEKKNTSLKLKDSSRGLKTSFLRKVHDGESKVYVTLKAFIVLKEEHEFQIKSVLFEGIIFICRRYRLNRLGFIFFFLWIFLNKRLKGWNADLMNKCHAFRAAGRTFLL